MKTYSLAPLLLVTLSGIVALCGCDQQPTPKDSTPSSPTSVASPSLSGNGSAVPATAKATAQMQPTTGNSAKGTVTFTDAPGGVRVVADFTGLTPGEHGFHLHEKGDCSAGDASSAAGHFNPTGMPHGSPDSDKHHLGDLGNLTAEANGNAHLDKAFNFLTLSGSNSIVGLGVIVHQGKDDFTSQPAGNSGARVACGAIQSQ